MSIPLSTFFKGQAYFKVLELLSTRTQPVRLRALAELSGMYVRSIELAVSSLVKQQVVSRKKTNGLILYSLNSSHPQASLLRSMFRLVVEAERELQSSRLHKKAQSVLAFSDSAIKLYRQVKR